MDTELVVGETKVQELLSYVLFVVAQEAACS